MGLISAHDREVLRARRSSRGLRRGARRSSSVLGAPAGDPGTRVAALRERNRRATPTAREIVKVAQLCFGIVLLETGAPTRTAKLVAQAPTRRHRAHRRPRAGITDPKSRPRYRRRSSTDQDRAWAATLPPCVQLRPLSRVSANAHPDEFTTGKNTSSSHSCSASCASHTNGLRRVAERRDRK